MFLFVQCGNSFFEPEYKYTLTFQTKINFEMLINKLKNYSLFGCHVGMSKIYIKTMF